MVYNPAFLTPEARARQFVVREDVLRVILDVIEANTGPSHQHLLVLGGRGLGKTTLVRRAADEVRARLSDAWYPLVFPEEPYEVRDVGELWLEALRVLADQTGDPQLVELHGRTRGERDPKRLEATALAAVAAHADRIGRRILLVIENLDLLLDQIPEADAWSLRKVLQDDPRFMLLGTALRSFDAITHHDQPFYEGFRRIELEPLTGPEIEELWRVVAGRPLDPRRALAIRVLTGGNPRLVVLLADLTQGTTLPEILDDLAHLVDRHTDYFKSRVEALDGQNRRVFLAVATLWRPATAGQIAAEARLPANQVSTALTRLERQGRVEAVGKKGKNRLYQVTERLYDIWYLMRRGPADARLRALIEFLVAYYEPAAEPGSRPLVAAEPEAHPGWSDASDLVGAADGDDPSGLDARILAGSLGRPDRACALLEHLMCAGGSVATVLPHALRLAASGFGAQVAEALAGHPVYRPLALALSAGSSLDGSAEERAIAADLDRTIAELRRLPSVWVDVRR